MLTTIPYISSQYNQEPSGANKLQYQGPKTGFLVSGPIHSTYFPSHLCTHVTFYKMSYYLQFLNFSVRTLTGTPYDAH
jgi:hypothetical protein